MARLASLTADRNAPTNLSPEKHQKLMNDSTIIKLDQRNRRLTAKLRNMGFKPFNTAKGTEAGGPLYEKKREAQAKLNYFKIRMRTRIIEKARKRHFRTADIHAFNAQFGDSYTLRYLVNSKHQVPTAFNIREKSEIVRLAYHPTFDRSDIQDLAHRIKAIQARAVLCDRQKTQYRGRRKRD